MVDVKSKRCGRDGCTKQPSYGKAGGKAEFCKQLAEAGMFSRAELANMSKERREKEAELVALRAEVDALRAEMGSSLQEVVKKLRLSESWLLVQLGRQVVKQEEDGTTDVSLESCIALVKEVRTLNKELHLGRRQTGATLALPGGRSNRFLSQRRRTRFTAPERRQGIRGRRKQRRTKKTPPRRTHRRGK